MLGTLAMLAFYQWFYVGYYSFHFVEVSDYKINKVFFSCCYSSLSHEQCLIFIDLDTLNTVYKISK